ARTKACRSKYEPKSRSISGCCRDLSGSAGAYPTNDLKSASNDAQRNKAAHEPQEPGTLGDPDNVAPEIKRRPRDQREVNDTRNEHQSDQPPSGILKRARYGNGGPERKWRR